jgi:hypothetical protein
VDQIKSGRIISPMLSNLRKALPGRFIDTMTGDVDPYALSLSCGETSITRSSQPGKTSRSRAFGAACD